MKGDVLLGLVINTALLLALVVLYETIPLQKTLRSRLLEIFIGILVGSVGLSVMLTPWRFSDGVNFDTRSILLSVTGLFFGSIPTSVAVLMTGALRLYQGGDGAAMGVSVILSSAGLGLLWRYFLRFRKKTPAWYELYIFGVIVHLVMLLCTNLLPPEIAPRVLQRIALPVMLIYPIGTVLLGQTLLRRDQRAQLEQALRTGTARFRSLFDNSPIAIWEEDFSLVKEQFDMLRQAGVTDFKAYWKEHPQEIGRLAGLIQIVEINLSSVKLLGAENREQIKRNLPDYFTEESLAVFEEELTALAEGRTEFKCEIPVRNLRGVPAILDLTLTVQPGCEETLERVLLSFLDITERKKTEEDLRSNEEKFRNLFNNSEVGMFRTRLDGSEILEFNEKYLKILDYSHEELRDIPSRDLWADPGERDRMVQLLNVEGQVTNFECGILNKQGETRRCIMSTRLYPDTGILEGSIQDITERKQAETERQTLLEIMQGVVVTKDLHDFLCLVHHSIANVIYAENFFVVLYNKNTDLFEEVYSVDKFDPPSAPLRLEKSTCAYVFRSGNPELMTETRFDELVTLGEVELVGTNSPSWLGVPLKTSRETIGVMVVQDYETPNRYSERDVNFLASIATQVAIVVEHKQTEELFRQQTEQLGLLYETSQRLNRTLDLNEIYQAICDFMSTIAVNDGLAISSFDSETQLITCRAYWMENSWLDVSPFPPLPLEEERNGTQSIAIRTGQSRLVNDFQALMKTAQSNYFVNHETNEVAQESPPEEDVTRSALIVPLKRGEIVTGVIQVMSYRLNAYTENQLKLLEALALHIASAEQNAMLYAEVQNELNERQLVEKSLRESESILRKVQGVNHMGSWEIDLNSKTVIASDEAHRIYGIEQGSMTLAYVQSIPLPEFRPILDAALTALISEGKRYDVEYKIKRVSDGEIRDIHSIAEYSAVSRTIIGSVQDITERKQSEESIQQRVKELETINQISLALRSVSKQDEMLSIVLDDALAILNTSHGSIVLYNKATDKLEKIISRGWFAHIIEPPQAIHEGIAGKVFASGLTSISHEFAAEPEVCAGVRTQIPPGWGGVCLPIRTAQQTLGVMIVSVPSERGLNVNEIRLLSILSEMTGAAMQRMGLHDQTVHRLEQLKALRDVDQAISSSRDMQLTLKILLAHTLTNLGVDAADVLFLRPGSNFLELAADLGFHTLLFNNVNLSDSVSGRAILEHYPVMPLDSETVKLCKNPQFLKFWEEEGFSGYWCVPLRVKGEVNGVLEVFCRTAITPDSEWLEFLEALAGQAAIAIDSTQLFETLQRSNQDLSLAYDATIEGWSRAMDLRDHETEGHTQRVTELTLKLARFMQVNESQLTGIRRGALLHDIGKMGVPDSILLKKGKLTDAEWVLMRKHPKLAHDMLTPSAYLDDALVIPYCHHEKWDGTGYPQGLAGDQIPLAARIFAIIDVWDALTSDRSYRKKWTEQKARKYVEEQSGRHFDPQVVEAFLMNIQMS